MIQLHNAVIEKVQTMADGTVQLRIGLPELPPEQMVELFTNINRSTKTIEVAQDAELNAKTPGQRLRSVMYVLWEQSYQTTYPEFQTFYAAKMENLISQFKERLQ